jgi:hypothetical protein
MSAQAGLQQQQHQQQQQTEHHNNHDLQMLLSKGDSQAANM